jgi:Helix-turn-helix domain
VTTKEPHSQEEVRDPTTQQAPPQGRGPQRSEGRLTDPADSGWGEDWSEDVERTYQAPPPLGLTEFDLALYRRLARYSSRGGIIPSRETLARELDVSVPTIKRSVRRLKAAGWLETSRRDQRNVKRGGRLDGGNRYHLKVSLNDLDEGLFPQVATRDQRDPACSNEGSRPKAAKPQVATRDHDGARSLGGGGKAKHQPRSQRGISPVDRRPSTPTVSEEKPREERVSSEAQVEQSSAPGGRRFRTMAEEKAWVAVRARLPPQLDDDIVGVLWKLQEAGMLETAHVVKMGQPGPGMSSWPR